jgi:myosin heavy subunit
LIVLSKNKKKENKVHIKLLKAFDILEAFGNAKTNSNDNSSRFGKQVNVQFNSRGKLSGAEFTEFLLETTRVTDILKSERTFHVFYSLLAGSCH